ncbi:MAG: transketolase [Candidatus Dadabacteria bacterium]|nr:MAG: transketolase [Candidatus Dadabacteria bacterium]
MRNRFVENLINYCENKKNVYLLTGDLGFSVLEPFIEKNPKNFFNMGVAEQNMMGVASGLALEGNKVFTYSISNFATSRCHEQIRNDICYHNLDVTVVAVGGGLPYGTHGYTHHGIEDITIIRCLPNMTVYVPADRFELEFCFNKIIKNKSPKYLRLAKGGEPDLYNKKIATKGNIIEHQKLSEINILSCGSILGEAIECSNHFRNKGIEVGLFSCPVISPESIPELKKLLSKGKTFITVEEHKKLGGFGSFVSEVSVALKKPARIISCGVLSEGYNLVGSQKYLRSLHGIDGAGLIKVVNNLLKK